MTDLVDTTEIEGIVGARRHVLVHLGRVRGTAGGPQVLYILHSHACRAREIDLRLCEYSLALDRAGDRGPWLLDDEVLALDVVDGDLVLDTDLPHDVELLEEPAP
jgi:hypothetical protein